MDKRTKEYKGNSPKRLLRLGQKQKLGQKIIWRKNYLDKNLIGQKSKEHFSPSRVLPHVIQV